MSREFTSVSRSEEETEELEGDEGGGSKSFLGSSIFRSSGTVAFFFFFFFVFEIQRLLCLYVKCRMKFGPLFLGDSV